MDKTLVFSVLSLLAIATAQRITTIHLDGVQYFISRMNPYSPELNYFLAYQYCRSLGLQLASFETKEKAESMTTYLKNAGYGTYDFWTSGNRLGTGMFLWMSTGLPFNATFDFFENSADAIQAGLLDPVDHNSNTSPQRTARDSSSGADKGCVILKQPTLKWMPEDCSIVKDFICEQTRCYYYNYGSIPVSSAQGRPITSTTPRMSTVGLKKFHTTSTTSLPMLMSAYAKLKAVVQTNNVQQPSFASLTLDHERVLEPDIVDEADTQDNNNSSSYDFEDDDLNSFQSGKIMNNDDNVEEHARLLTEIKPIGANGLPNDENIAKKDFYNSEDTDEVDSTSSENEDVSHFKLNDVKSSEKNLPTTMLPAVEVRLKQISQEVEKATNANENKNLLSHSINNHVSDDIGRQSFLSLTDLIRTLRPNDKQIVPQIDSDYSNAMRVLGENSGSVVIKNNEDELHQPNRGYF